MHLESVGNFPFNEGNQLLLTVDAELSVDAFAMSRDCILADKQALLNMSCIMADRQRRQDLDFAFRKTESIP